MKNNTILFSIIIALLMFFYKAFFAAPIDVNDQVTISPKVEKVLVLLDSINFDLHVFSDAKFQTLKDLSVGLVEVSVGKANPFRPKN